MQKTLYFKFSLVTIVSISVIMAVQILAGYRFRLHGYNQELIHTTEQTIVRLEKNVGDFIEVYAVFDYENAIAREMANADFAAIIIDDQNIAHSFGKQHYTKGKIRNDKNVVVDYDPDSPQHRHLLQGCVYQSERTIQKNGKVIGKIEIYTTNQRLAKTLEEFVKVSFIQTVVVCIFLSLILLFSIRKLLTNPIRELAEAAGSIASGDYKTRAKVRSEDEIGKLATTFNSMTEQLIQTLKNLQKEINERKRAEEQVRFLSSITEFTTDAILVTDTDFTVTYLNKSFEKLFGYSLEDLKGKTPDSLNAEPMSAQIQKELYETVASGKEFIGESQNRRKDGSTFICEFKVMPFKNQSGQTYAYVGVQRDITARKQAELALRESEEKFRNFAEQSFVGFYIAQDGVFKYVNPKFADIFGYTVEECQDNMQLHQLVHAEDLATVMEQIRRRIEGEVNAVNYRFRGIKKTGETIHLDVYGSSLVYDKKPAVIGTMLDITKDLEMEKRLAQSQRIESIGNLAGGIAHDFNNILFPIVGMSELLLEDLPHQSQQYENAQEILKAGKRGSDLVKQILTFSRQAEHKLVPVRVQQVLKEVLKLTRATIPANIEINQDIQPDCGMTMADPTQIHQVAMNIITNAFHAIGATGGAITVNFKETVLNADELLDSFLNPGRYALLSISDTGHGISDDLKAKIFEPYFTTKEQGKGTGLGLAVVYGIIKEHKGDIKVYSEIGQGTTFNIYLPLLDRPDDVEIAAPEEYEGGNERILLIDDEEAVVNLEKQMLERLGYHVKSRLNSLEALELFRTKPFSFDLVISDMTMPNMTGDRLAAEIKSIRPDIPVIICTGFSERMNDQKADVLGIAGILMKPIVKTELAKTVRNVLEETKKDCKSIKEKSA